MLNEINFPFTFVKALVKFYNDVWPEGFLSTELGKIYGDYKPAHMSISG